jgi:hypothetical protein
MSQNKVKAAGSKTTGDDGIRTSTFSVVRNGPLRRVINEALDTLPHPNSLIPGKTKITVELCDDGQIQIDYSAGYQRRLKASVAEMTGNK